MIRVATIVGARPQFIKSTPVSDALRKDGNFEEILIHTGQHYDKNMSEVFFDELSIGKAAINLGVGSGSHGQQTGRMLEAIEKALINLDDIRAVLVYGDTNSTVAGALAASKLSIPVVHIEAGLRSFDKSMPEEINRVLSDHISEVLFTPTIQATRNLLREGIAHGLIHQVGDVMFDAMCRFEKKATSRNTLSRYNLKPQAYILATIHRAENTDNDENLETIWQALLRVSEKMPVIWPVHPRTQEKILKRSYNVSASKNIKLVEPVGYLDMLHLESKASLIVTDSGGVQKEAYFSGVLCVTLRNETEWIELVEAKANFLLPPSNVEEVSEGILSFLQREFPESRCSMFGDGRSAEKIATILTQQFG